MFQAAQMVGVYGEVRVPSGSLQPDLKRTI